MNNTYSVGLFTLLAFLTTCNKLGLKYYNPNATNTYEQHAIPGHIARDFVKKYSKHD